MFLLKPFIKSQNNKNNNNHFISLSFIIEKYYNN